MSGFRTRCAAPKWELETLHKLDISLLMSAHRIVFDLEEIGEDLIGLGKAALAAAKEKEGTDRLRKGNILEEVEDKDVLGRQG